MNDYEKYHYNKEALTNSAVNLGSIKVNPIADLEQVRNMINKYTDETATVNPKLSQDWCFVDCK